MPNVPLHLRMFGASVLLVYLLLVGASGSVQLGTNDNVAISTGGAVAADDGRCSEIGAKILRTRAHAVDAAVATALCLGVVNPLSSGIGGGSFMLVRSASTSNIQAYNMRETAPLAASQDMYDKDPKSKVVGALAMGVPGEIAGLYEAWKTHGLVPWYYLVRPAMFLAKHGFVVSQYLAQNLKKDKHIIMADPGLKQIFAPNGRLLKSGDICYNKQLAHTLETIAENGPQALYSGTLGEKIVEEVRKAGGILTMEDLKSYQVDVTSPMEFSVMGGTIYGMPPPSSGTLGLALVVNILKAYQTQHILDGPAGLHRLIEAMKHMFAIRTGLGDPKFVNISSTVSKMLSPTYAGKIREKILENTTHPPDYYNPKWSQVEDHIGTSHFSIVDAQRNVVSMTTTVNSRFGAGVLLPSTGIIINNEMDDFSIPSQKSDNTLPPSPSNFIAPGKRPLSSMTPLIIMKDDEVVAVLGGSGGLQIVPAVIQVFLKNFILGMPPAPAIFSPRVHHQLVPNVVRYENWTTISGQHIELEKEALQFLKSRNHELEQMTNPAVCQLIVQLQNKQSTRKGLLIAVSDPRKGGTPAV